MFEQKKEYYDHTTTLEAFIATEDRTKRKPAVLVFPSWHGRDDFACEKARALAKAGYVGIAADMYGGAKLGNSLEENAALMAPFIEDRKLLLQRVIAAFVMAKTLDFVDAEQIAAIGFCFGGMCALDLARCGNILKAAVSFHGLLDPPPTPIAKEIPAKVLAMTGFEDPWVSPEQALAFQKEMTTLKADWQYVSLGHTKHGFTNPICTDPKSPNFYHPLNAQRAWKMMLNLFEEVFS